MKKNAAIIQSPSLNFCFFLHEKQSGLLTTTFAFYTPKLSSRA